MPQSALSQAVAVAWLLWLRVCVMDATEHTTMTDTTSARKRNCWRSWLEEGNEKDSIDTKRKGG